MVYRSGGPWNRGLGRRPCSPPSRAGTDHKYSFPVLSQFARDILVISVSTVSSEATFSTVGRIIEERRSSLAPKTVEAIICLKDWNRAEERKQHQLEDPEIEFAAADLDID
jgi:inhibitor of KinA sporulation pathway (predicted exonuclease)